MPRFYTLPPMEIPYPYILINANNPSNGIRYIAKYRDIVSAVIIDSGVEIFRDPKAKEYPGGPGQWIRKLVALWKRVKNMVPGAEVYVTAPDYPDDYHPGSLWLSKEITNIERSASNALLATKLFHDVNWLIPVQGHYEKPRSIIRGLMLLEDAGVLDWVSKHSQYIAIANLCVSKKCSTIASTVREARRWLEEHGYNLRIHVFGPAVNCIAKVKDVIFSWDSTAWTRPRAPNGSSAWSKNERAYLFLTWIHRYADLIELPAHPPSMRRRLMKNNNAIVA